MTSSRTALSLFLFALFFCSTTAPGPYGAATPPDSGEATGELDRAVRRGDASRVRILVTERPSAADQLFLDYLERDIGEGEDSKERALALDQARLLAEVFCRIYEYDFELGLVAYWRKADLETKQVLLNVLRDHLSLLDRRRTIFEPPRRSHLEASNLSKEFLKISERYRQLDFVKGVTQTLLVASSLGVVHSLRALRWAKSSGDEWAVAWASYFYGANSGGSGKARAAIDAALKSARERGLTKLEQRILGRLAWIALSQGDSDGHIEHFERALALARTLPARESMVGRFGQRPYPAELGYLVNLWLAYKWKKQEETAQTTFGEMIRRARQLGGSETELAVLVDTMTQFYQPGLHKEVAERAELLARQAGHPEWLATVLLNKAEALGAASQCTAAVETATEALRLYEGIPDRGMMVDALFVRGRCRLLMGQPAQGRKDFEQAVQIAGGFGDSEFAANIHYAAGDEFRRQRQPQIAIEFLTRALAAARQTDNPYLIASVLYRRALTPPGATQQSYADLQEAVGYAERYSELYGDCSFELQLSRALASEHRLRGDFPASVEVYKRIAKKARAEELGRWELAAYRDLADTYAREMGERELALKYASRAREQMEGTSDRCRPNDCNGLGNMFSTVGQPTVALDYYDRALRQLEDNTGDHEPLRRALHRNRALLFAKLGDYDAALGEREKEFALIPLTHEAYPGPEQLQKAAWFNEVSRLYFLMEDPKRGLQYALEAIQSERVHAGGPRFGIYAAEFMPGDALLFAEKEQEALQFFTTQLEKAREAGSPVGERRMLERVARVYRQMKKWQEGRQALLAAIELDKKHPTEAAGGLAGSHLALGALELDAGRLEEATEHLLVARDAVSPFESDKQWQIEITLAQASARSGKADHAENHYARAFELLESRHEKLRPEEFRLLYGIGRHEIYDEYAGYLAARATETGNPRYAEKAFLVAERRRAQGLWDLLAAGWTQLPTVNQPEWVRRRIELEARLAAKQDALRMQYGRPAGKRNAAFIESLQADLRQTQLEHSQLLTALAQQTLRYAQETTLPSQLLPALRRRLPPGRAVLEYLVTKDRVFTFLLTSNGLQIHAMPLDRRELRRQVNRLLRPFARLRRGELDLTRLNFDLKTAHALYKQIFAPLEGSLGQISEILVVPDDVLFYLPLELLVDRLPQKRPPAGILFQEYEQAGFLLHRYTMSYLTAAAQLSQPTEALPGEMTRPTLLAMADPIPGPAPSEFNPQDSPPRLLRAGYADALFTPVPGSSAEMKEIQKYFSSATVKVLTGSDASEAGYKALSGDRAVIHVATHAIIFDDRPLYSTLILAPDAEAHEDGFLQAYEILRYPLQARLVVLSACETALGPLGRGEGLTGLVGAFRQAGAKSVLATLWSIDESAAELMGLFYQAMAEGKATPRALQEAKQKLATQRLRYGSVELSLGHPFFWAPFILVGTAE